MSPGADLGRVAILGVGLIGGSIGWGLRHADAAEVVGVDSGDGVLDRALERGLIDSAERDPAAGVREADMVVFAVPVARFGSLLSAARAGLAPGTVVTDVGSAKAAVVEEARTSLAGTGVEFLGGHPIAGTAESGVEAALGNLFQDAFCVITPEADTSDRARNRVEALWAALGAETVHMAPEEHDRVLAATSHLPHMLAYSLIQTFGALPPEEGLARFAAGGFRDLTRIAGSDAVMWRDIALTNREALLEMIDAFDRQLATVREAVAEADGPRLEAYFQEARQLRRGLDEPGGKGGSGRV